VGGQAEAEHQQAASRAQGLPILSARQDYRPAETKHGLLTSPTSPCDRGFCTWSRSSTGQPGECCPEAAQVREVLVQLCVACGGGIGGSEGGDEK
jgi:hypothetical protein